MAEASHMKRDAPGERTLEQVDAFNRLFSEVPKPCGWPGFMRPTPTFDYVKRIRRGCGPYMDRLRSERAGPIINHQVDETGAFPAPNNPAANLYPLPPPPERRLDDDQDAIAYFDPPRDMKPCAMDQLAVVAQLELTNPYFSQVFAADPGGVYTPRPNDAWIVKETDYTEMFFKSCKELKPGEFLFSEKFDLCQAMNAVEIMEPKMDSGMVRRKPIDISAPSPKLQKYTSGSYTTTDVITLIDSQLAMISSWLIFNESLDDTVFTNILQLRVDTLFPNDSLLRTIFNGIRMFVSVIVQIVESAEIIPEDDCFNRKLPDNALFVGQPSLVEVRNALRTEIIRQKNAKNFLIDKHFEHDRLVGTKRNAETPKDALYVRLCFLYEVLTSMQRAFPRLVPENDANADREEIDYANPSGVVGNRRARGNAGLWSAENLRTLTPPCRFQVALYFLSLSATSVEHGQPPPGIGWRVYDRNEKVIVYDFEFDQTLGLDIADGIYDETQDGDFSWLPCVAPGLNFHQQPNAFPRTVKHVSRHKAYRFFIHLLSDLVRCLLSIECVCWTVDDVLDSIYSWQHQHIVIRSAMQLYLLSDRDYVLEVWNVGQLILNATDEYANADYVRYVTDLFNTTVFENQHFYLPEMPSCPRIDKELVFKRLETLVGPTPTEKQKTIVCTRYSLGQGIRRLTKDLSQVHSFHLTAAVHSTYHFRQRFCVQIADDYASLMPRAKHIEREISEMYKVVNRAAISTHVLRLINQKCEPDAAPRIPELQPCPPIFSNYIALHTFLLARRQLALTLQQDLVSLDELSIILYLYYLVSERLGTCYHRILYNHLVCPSVIDFLKQNVSQKFRDLVVRVVDRNDNLEHRLRRRRNRLLSQQRGHRADMYMCYALVNLVKARVSEGYLDSRPNERERFSHRLKQAFPPSVRNDWDNWQFSPTYEDYVKFREDTTTHFLDEPAPLSYYKNFALHAGYYDELMRPTEQYEDFRSENFHWNAFVSQIQDPTWFKSKYGFRLSFRNPERIFPPEVLIPDNIIEESPIKMKPQPKKKRKGDKA